MEAHYPKLIAAQKNQIYLSPTTVDRTVKPSSLFSFIDLSQWILLMLLNVVCWGFIMFAGNLIL